MLRFRFATPCCLLLAGVSPAKAEVPIAISVPGLNMVAQFHAERAQIYECKTSADGKANWQFREPVASLFENGRTVGTHFAGPSWRIGENTVKGKLVAKVAAANSDDAPWLRLDVIEVTGSGRLDGVTAIQRINTAGGNLVGSCDKVGALRAVPYSADYVFLKK